MKPGYKTTEFWLSLAAVLLGAIMSSGILELPGISPVVGQLIGIAASILGALGYTVARSFVKVQDAKAAAQVLTSSANPPKP